MKQSMLAILAVSALAFAACKTDDQGSCPSGDPAVNQTGAACCSSSQKTVNEQAALTEDSEEGVMTPGGVQMKEAETEGSY